MGALLRILPLLFLLTAPARGNFVYPQRSEVWDCSRRMSMAPLALPQSFVTEHLLRTHTIHGKHVHEVLVVSEFHVDDELLTRTYHREVRDGRATGATFGPGGPEAWHLEQVTPVIRFASRFYDERKHWAPHYLAEVPLIARRYLNDSVYVEVIRKSTGLVVGGERFLLGPFGIRNGRRVPEGVLVRQLYGPFRGGFRPANEQEATGALPRPPQRLAMGQHLDIDYERATVVSPDPEDHDLRVGLEVEIGLVAIEPTLPRALRGKIWVELWLQIMRAIFRFHDDNLNFYGTTVTAYTDRENAELFRWMGWEDLRHYRRDGRIVRLAADAAAPAIRVANEDMDWFPIIYYPHRVMSFNGAVADGQRPLFRAPNLSRRRLEVAGGAEVAPFALEGIGGLVEQLSGPEIFSRNAEASILRVVEMHGLHLRTLHGTRGEPVRRERVVEAFWGVEEMLRDLDGRLSELATNSVAEVRHRVARLLGRLAMVPWRPNYLNRELITRNHLVPFLADSSELVRAQVLVALRNAFADGELFDVAANVMDLDLDTDMVSTIEGLGMTVEPFPTTAQQRTEALAAASARLGSASAPAAAPLRAARTALTRFFAGTDAEPQRASAALGAVPGLTRELANDLLIVACAMRRE